MRDVPYVHAGSNFQKPNCHPPTQTGWNVFRDHNEKAHPEIRCPASPIPSVLGIAGETDSGGATGGRMPPAERTSSIVGMIRPRSLLERKMSRQANRTSRSGCPGDFEAILNASGT